MKKSIFLAVTLALIGFSQTHAQPLQKTRWTSEFDVPINGTALFSFGRDTCNITNSRGREIVRSVFHVSHDTVTIRDIGGDIACGPEVGVYTYHISKNILILMFVRDSCEGRAHALIGREWIRAGK
jgi:hypothetical protein